MNHEIHASHPRYFSNYSRIFDSFQDPSFKISEPSLKEYSSTPSNQVCTNGLQNPKGATSITCDVGNEQTYTCLAKNCHITTVNNEVKDLSNYYFENCEPVGITKQTPKPLHPYEFHLSTDKKLILVTSGWHLTTNSTVEEVKGKFGCLIAGSAVNQIKARK
ncbi:hypothetical protein O181_002178 [Austropuccinia psidii MF-1]|uniref:Uncharacterized protein n=1 Tax=Austropuccinia psidii MF-1 TaxID=1389203 RepID=A0A9Q3BC87_9BASI|nr:hypothetical protein [Austropuccinia psidii MF-1]